MKQMGLARNGQTAVWRYRRMDATARTNQGGDNMNHDYAHCADFNNDCPKDCFRAQLVRDLKQRTDLLGLPFSFMHFKGTEECKKKEVTE